MDLEILQDYLTEARELLEAAQEETMRLEAEPGNQEALASVFRAFHTIKGGASFLELHHLVACAHRLENLLDKLRSHVLPVTPPRIEVILQGLDVIGQMLQEVAQGNEPAAGPSDLWELIESLSSDSPDCTEDVNSGQAAAPEPLASEAPGHESPEHHDTCLNSPDGEPPPAPLSAPDNTKAASPQKAPAASKRAETPENSLRIEAPRLDAVMNQVGELVLLRNRLASGVASLGKEDETMSRLAREMDLTVNDLQSTVMRLRMQPCKRLFQNLPRVVRDVSRQLGKEVRLEIVGDDVEIDKAVVDALSAPITHLVRNSLDHGIETPKVRSAANKAPVGVLRVAAIHLGDKVRIEVSDDGKGIDRRQVTLKAVEKRVITSEQAAHLSEQEALELIFRPGFSTKEQASDISGRGVGMDVVKETTRKLRGRLSVETQPGQGTRIAMEFPLTLAVLPVLYLRLRNDTYALPVSSIENLIDVEEDRIHRLGGRATYRVSGTQTVPIVDLGAILQNNPLRIGAENVEGVLTERCLFVVSEVLGNEDSVVKPIDFLTTANWYQGATISGRGNVVLILDASALNASWSMALERSI